MKKPVQHMVMRWYVKQRLVYARPGKSQPARLWTWCPNHFSVSNKLSLRIWEQKGFVPKKVTLLFPNRLEVYF
jgi:hypothetical protein